jgi:nitrile hydratase beta subunit
MNGIHDMGGLHGFGAVAVEHNEPVFHSRWEGRVYAITQVLDTTGIYNLDEHRHEIELMHPADYLRDGYYGRWLFAMDSILSRKNILKPAEVAARIAERAHDASRVTKPDTAGRNWPLPPEQKIRWGAWRNEIEVTAKFAAGDKVRVRNWQPPGHTRLPAYVRGKVGTVSIVDTQAWIFPDTRAHNAGENPQPVYNVAFEAKELWGDFAESGVVVNVDLSESYLESVE